MYLKFFCTLVVVLLNLILLPFHSLEARQLAPGISGIVQDSENQPVEFATVSLLTADSLFVKGEVTNRDGEFMIRNVQPGTYLLEIRNVAFERYYSDLFDIVSGEIKEMGSITLVRAVGQMEQVNVTATRPIIEIFPDRTVFNVEGSINAAGNDGLELLGKAPGVMIDPDNNIVMQGRSGVRVYINGRATRLSGDDLTAMLQSMQSDNIESIEIITNPSSRYDAEGNAGIINIRLKKNVRLGFNGSLNANFTQGRYGRTSHGLNTNYQEGRVNLYSNLTGFYNNFQSDYVDTRIQNNLILDQEALGLNRNMGLNFSSGLIYTLNERNSFSLTSNIILNDRNEDNKSNTPVMNVSDSSLREILLSNVISDINSNNYLFSGNYRFEPSGNTTIDIDASFSKFSRTSDTDQPNTWLGPNGSTVQREVNNRFLTDSGIDLWAAQADLEQRFGSVQFSAGGKYSSISTVNDFAFYDIVAGTQILDVNRSNKFEYKEEIVAGYMILQMPIGQKVNLSAGLRLEHTMSVGELTSEQEIQNQNVDRSYTDLFPNVGISYRNGTRTMLGLSVGRRINRPSYQELNPFETKLSELVFFKGNPFLVPEKTMNYQFNFSFHQKLTGSIRHSVTSNYFASILEVLGTEQSMLIPQNMDEINITSFNVSYPVRVMKNWEIIGFAALNREYYRGQLQNADIDLSLTTYNFRFQNSVTLPAGITMDATYAYNSPFIWRGSLEIQSYSRIDIGVRKNFLENRLQLRITGSDVLRQGGDFIYSGNYGGIDIAGVRSVDNQRVGISLTWRFGNQELRAAQRRTSALQEETQRLSD
ncbi:MAG: TonB-dependent receptor [Bacteroidetes bacterium]|nr:TonB-dependent receptor [Bacteroidota bacterium]MCH8524808.1 TonB-dependent receptor [Balneolales bacterium]